ncbi:25959_t:CDS:2, partial [Gigaspora rosea]
KRNGSLNSNGSEKGKAVDVDSDVKKVPREGIKFGPEAGKAFADLFGNVPVDSNNFGNKGIHVIKREYNEWCKTGLLLDKALFTGDIEYVQLARQVAFEKAYVVRVADEDAWNVAAKMTSDDWLDPMSQLLSGKCERTRVAAQQFPENKHSKISDRQSFFSGNVRPPSMNSLSNEAFSPDLSASIFCDSHRTSYSDAGASNRTASSKLVVCYLCEGIGLWTRSFVVEALDQQEVNHTRIEFSPKYIIGKGFNSSTSSYGMVRKENFALPKGVMELAF